MRENEGLPFRQVDPSFAPAYNMAVNKRILPLLILGLLGACLMLAAQTPKKLSPKDLPPQFRKWLEEEVVYIISQKERDVFLQLESERERNIFIEAFWKQRNPNPNSTTNEFKAEHYRRIAYANQWFGRESPAPGWRTDMGRIYIMLGEAKEVQKYENLPELKPIITWFYDGMAEYGLPGSFYIAFWKKDNVGEYRLYSPINDGPQNLLTHYKGDMTESDSAFQQLLKIEPNVATISLSLIPGEAMFSATPSLASEVLIRQSIPAAPYEKIKSDYAEKLLKYKDMIEVDYTANYILNESLIKVFQDAAGLTFVHYLIEPAKLTFEQVQDRYRTDIQVNGIITDPGGKTVYQFDRSVSLDLDADQLARMRAKTFSFQDLFPLVPGQYKASFLWKNKISKEFTSVEANILIPEPAGFSMSSPVLAYAVDRESKYKAANKSFMLGNVQFAPTANSLFLPDETLYAFFQIRGLPDPLRTGGAVEYTILKESAVVKSLSRSFKDMPGRMDFFETFPLAGYLSAHYELKIAILNPDKTERLSTSARFDIAPVARLIRPWVLSLPLPPSNDPSFSNILGVQYLERNDLAKARPLLESAYRRDPASTRYALDYGRALAAASDHAAIKAVARPFMADDRKFDFLLLIGDASKALGEFAEAVAYYKDYLTHFGTNIPVLNSIGDCYIKLGDTAQALVALERSLQLNPNQEALKALVKSLKEKK